MLKMFHYMKERWHYIVMIILLLFVQAFCDLSLPDYTSKIVNVGIQQKGIEDGVPDTLRKESMEQISLFLEEEDSEKVKASYEEDGDIYRLKEITREEREELNQILGIPEMVVSGLWDDSSKEVAKIKEQLQVPEEAKLLEVFAQMPKEQLSAMKEGMTEKFEEMPESIVTQGAGKGYGRFADTVYSHKRSENAGTGASCHGSSHYGDFLILPGGSNPW